MVRLWSDSEARLIQWIKYEKVGFCDWIIIIIGFMICNQTKRNQLQRWTTTTTCNWHIPATDIHLCHHLQHLLRHLRHLLTTTLTPPPPEKLFMRCQETTMMWSSGREVGHGKMPLMDPWLRPHQRRQRCSPVMFRLRYRIRGRDRGVDRLVLWINNRLLLLQVHC